jgi:hypothetical protein
MIAAKIGTPAIIIRAHAVLASARTEPTERSKPPETKSMAMPMTITPVGTSPTAMARKFAMVRK